MDRSRFGPDERRADIARMQSEEFDLVVIGGGVTGVGAALDAATRGLSVALIEQRDWAAGTSSRSSKLIHGGLRYLEQFEFGLVREAKHEQTLMLERLCPHLVKPVPFLYPVQKRVFERFYIGAGVALYDLLAGRKAVPFHRHLGGRRTSELFPSLSRKRVHGSIEY
jgi:glycerol-3-phosphate dehydrogenase